MKHFSIVVAVDEAMGIGLKGTLPWRLSRDMQHFKDITIPCRAVGKTNAVIMGRKTWASLPDKYRPLPGRLNVVLTKQCDFVVPEGVLCADSLEGALLQIDQLSNIADIFLIGGGVVFVEGLQHPLCQKLFLTCIESNFHCDVFFPAIPSSYVLVSKEPPLQEAGVPFYFCEYHMNPKG